MYTKIVSLLLLVLVIEDVALSCRPDLIRTCKYYHSLTDSTIKLLDPDNIDTECKKYDGLFNCVTPFIWNCDLKVRIHWQPIKKQIQTLCTTSKTAYIETGSCWTDEETEYFIDECNMELHDNLEKNPCGELDNYVVCLREAAEDFCSDEAGEVIAGLAISYVSVMKDGLGCTTTRSTTTMASTTPHEAASSASREALSLGTTTKLEQDVVWPLTSSSFTLTTDEDQGTQRLEQDVAPTNTTVSHGTSTRVQVKLQTHTQTTSPTISKTGALSGASSATTCVYIVICVSLVSIV